MNIRELHMIEDKLDLLRLELYDINVNLTNIQNQINKIINENSSTPKPNTPETNSNQ